MAGRRQPRYVRGRSRAFQLIAQTEITTRPLAILKFYLHLYLPPFHHSVFNSPDQVVCGLADSPFPEYSTSKNGHIIRITKG